MSTDSGSPIPERPTRRLTLPRIVSLEAHRGRPEPPALEHFKPPPTSDRDAIVFTVQLAGTVPARAYGPALFVGDVEVSASERIGDRTWQFVFSEPERLEPGAPIEWGWMRDPPDRRTPTAYRYNRARKRFVAIRESMQAPWPWHKIKTVSEARVVLAA